MHAVDLERARQIVRIWLKDRSLTASQLAVRAGVERSVVARFLNGGNITPTTAARLVEAVRPGMTAGERIGLAEAFGLSRFSELAASHSEAIPELDTRAIGDPNIAVLVRGGQLLAQAEAMTYVDIERSVGLFFQAEQVFAHLHNNAVLAARLGVQVLINMGDLDQAERELARVERTHAAGLDPLSQASLASARGWLTFDRADIAACTYIFQHNLRHATQHGFQHHIIEAHHFLGMCCTAQAQLSVSPSDKWQLLQRAQAHLNIWRADAEGRGDVSAMAFASFRAGQALDAQGRHTDAHHSFAQARNLFKGDFARNHVSIHQADAWLEEGETAKARKAGEAAIAEWSARRYGQGMSRGARVAAQALWQEGKLEQALAWAALAVGFDPHGVYGPGRQPIEALARDIGQHVRQTSRVKARTVYEALHADAYACEGVFKSLSASPVDRRQLIDRVLARALSIEGLPET